MKGKGSAWHLYRGRRGFGDNSCSECGLPRKAHECSVCGCVKPQHCKSFCVMHYWRLWSGGEIGPAGSMVLRPLEDRFWEKVDKNGPTPEHVRGIGRCWVWAAHKTDGYGRLQVSKKGLPYRSQLAHRLSWTIANGPIPKGLFICHKCDNSACVRPSHLFLGTAADNDLDRDKKARHYAKLTSKDVAVIRRRHAKGDVTCAALAREYSIDISQMCRVVRKLAWRHIA